MCVSGVRLPRGAAQSGEPPGRAEPWPPVADALSNRYRVMIFSLFTRRIPGIFGGRCRNADARSVRKFRVNFFFRSFVAFVWHLVKQITKRNLLFKAKMNKKCSYKFFSNVDGFWGKIRESVKAHLINFSPSKIPFFRTWTNIYSKNYRL